MKKRMFSIFMVLVLTLLLCACGNPKPDKQKTETDTETATVQPDGPESNTEPAGDMSFTPVTHRISTGASACAVLKDNGTVACSLDTSEDEYISVHDEWKSWTDVVDLEMTEEILAGVKKDGTVVWCGGRTREYEWLKDPKTMGVIDTWTDVVQVATGCYDIAALRSDGSIEVTGTIWTEDLEETKGFKQVSVYDALVGLRQDGTVFLYAPSKYEGQTWEYDVSGWTDIVQVSAGFDHVAGLKKDGTVVATGNNEQGQCDVKDWKDIKQVIAGRFHTIGLKTDGTIVYCGESLGNGEEFDFKDWKDIVEISGFFDQTMGLKADGTVLYTGLADRINPTADSTK